VGGAEGFVQIELHAVKAEVTKFHLSQQGVQVSPIAVEKSPSFVDKLAYLSDVRVK
jgi:hypothetical protein